MTSTDSFGYLAELGRASGAENLHSPDPILAAQAALHVIVAWGYCRRAGLSPAPLNGLLTDEQVRAAWDQMSHQLVQWAQSVESFADRWDDCDSPSDADDLCTDLLERRTDVWAAEAGFATAGRPADTAQFDTAARDHEGVLATVVGFRWFENHREPFLSSASDSLPWWLSDHLRAVAAATERRAEATLPPPEYFAVVRAVRRWKSSDPEVIPALGALKKGPPAGMRTFTWVSPNGTLTARLDVLARTTADHRRTAAYPLVFERGADTPAIELAGTPIRLGTVQRIVNEAAVVSATIAEWWADSDGRLFVGDPPTEWLRLVPPTE